MIEKETRKIEIRTIILILSKLGTIIWNAYYCNIKIDTIKIDIGCSEHLKNVEISIIVTIFLNPYPLN